MRKLFYFILPCLLLLSTGCDRTPSGVIPPHEMASLLADIHRGEGVVEMNRREYRSDTAKMALMEAIYLKHSVTQEMVDTSFDWYGHHIDEYMKVYSEVMDILQNEIDQSNAVAARTQIAAVGDSADTWGNASRYILTGTTPVNNINLTISPDENSEPGDNYTLNFKIINSVSPMKSFIGAEYTDGQLEWMENTINESGKVNFTLITDSTKEVSRIFASIMPAIANNETVFIDSVSLTRTRLKRNMYSRRFNQKKITPLVRISEDLDSIQIEPDTHTNER